MRPQTRALLESTKTISLHTSPYTYVRTIVMESKLLDEHEYAKLLKMDLSEIIQYLEETTYKKEIDELAVHESGVQLVEHAVHRNFRRAVEKLRRISDDTLRFLVDVYLWRNDVQNIKTILRAKLNNEKIERVQNMFIPGSITKEELLALYRLPTVEDILQKTNLPFLKQPLALYREVGLAAFESAMTKAYYESTLTIAQRIAGEGGALREFLLLEVDVINILTILKLKHEGALPERITNYLIYEPVSSEVSLGSQTRKRLLTKLIAAPDVPTAFAVLEKTRFKTAITTAAKSYTEKRSLLEAERELQAYLLRKAILLIHQNPLSVDVVVGYLFAKVNEIRNIFMLIKGKQLGVPTAFLEAELIMR
jgi:V/A-type H+/Na+-transporting ATPase subunit C